MKWVKYDSDETPPERKDMLIRYRDDDVFIDKGYFRDGEFWGEDGFSLSYFDITHWLLIKHPEE